MIETTLVVMAAGMGSRFGGLKQLTPIGQNAEVMIDYSVYDAMKAGFGKIVFVIKREFEKEFKEGVGNRIANKIKVDYVYQESPRAKPYGTAHAVLCCKDAVNTPFAVINADDFYGAAAYRALHSHLVASKEDAMVGFALENTLTENGTVSRGICTVQDGMLTGITEHIAIAKENDFPRGTIASMNMWGFGPHIFSVLSAGFAQFLKTADLERDEFFLPEVVGQMIREGKAKVRVLTTDEKWYGITYLEDKKSVADAMDKMKKAGQYEGL